MHFDPTPDQLRWRDTARAFAREIIAPRADQLDRDNQVPYDIMAQMADVGFMGLTLPEQYGGRGGDFVAYCLALEEIGRADAGIAIAMEAHITLGCAPIAARSLKLTARALCPMSPGADNARSK